MRPSTILSAIAFAGAVVATAAPEPANDAESSTTITIRVTSTVTTTSYIATETVTGTPPADANQTGSPSVLSLVTMPASTMKTMQYGPGATAAPSASASGAAYHNSASPLLSSREVVLAGALSALSMVLAIL